MQNPIFSCAPYSLKGVHFIFTFFISISQSVLGYLCSLKQPTALFRLIWMNLWLVNVIIDGTKQHVSYKRRGHVILVAHTLKNVVSHGQSSCDPTTPTLRRPAQAIQHLERHHHQGGAESNTARVWGLTAVFKPLRSTYNSAESARARPTCPWKPAFICFSSCLARSMNSMQLVCFCPSSLFIAAAGHLHGFLRGGQTQRVEKVD